MEPINIVKSVAAHLDIMNVDTDMIIPKQFLKTIKKTGLGQFLFYEMRYDPAASDKAGKPVLKDDFILNKKPFDQAKILIAGSNFGCGSSREHAVWALADFGVRVVITTSFGDIFKNNCLNNGILPITLDEASVAKLAEFTKKASSANDESTMITVALKTNTITFGNETLNFDIDPEIKKNLLLGLDDIAKTLNKLDKIAAFEDTKKSQEPWKYIDSSINN